jgi:hypothetical protein
LAVDFQFAVLRSDDTARNALHIVRFVDHGTVEVSARCGLYFQMFLDSRTVEAGRR